MYSIFIKGVDKTSLLMVGSLNVLKGADNRSNCSLSLKTTSAYTDVLGHDLQVKNGSAVVFGGIIKTVNITKLEPGTGTTKTLRIDIESNGYSDIPARRTTSTFQSNKYAGEIVTHVINTTLNSASANESIGIGTISNGALLTNYSAVCKSAKDIFDDMADASGFKWYINDNRELNFIEEDTVTDADNDLVEGGAFTDFYVTGVDISLENYRNKQFVRGGTAEDGNALQVIVSDDTEIAARKTAEGEEYSSGVYGNVIEDSNIKSVEDATAVGENALKKYGFAPSTIQFTSFTSWEAGTRLKVNLPTFGINEDTYYLIESVSIDDLDDVNLKFTVTATKRKETDFSTQKSDDYINYFESITKKTQLSSGDNADTPVPFFEGVTNEAAVAVTTTEVVAAEKTIAVSSRSKIIVSFSCEIVATGAANVTAITYIGGVAQTYQPTMYCAGAQSYVLTYIDYKNAVEAADVVVSVKLLTDANAGDISIGHAVLVTQVFPSAMPYLSDPSSFALSVISDAEIDLSWVNPTEATFTEVELYRHTADLSGQTRAWCDTNATLAYHGADEAYNNTGLSAETTYYYAIFAEHTVDGSAHYSAGVSWNGTTEAGAAIVLAGGTTTQKIYKYDIATLTKQAESSTYGAIFCFACVDNYVYVCGNVQKIYKYDILTLTKQAESLSCGYDITFIVSDETHLYISSASQKIYKYDIATLTKQAESDSYGGTIERLVLEGGYIYACGSGVGKIFKYDISTLTKQAESVSYGSFNNDLYTDGTYIYVGSYDSVKQYDLATLAFQQSITITSGDHIDAILVDGDYIYFGGSKQILWKYDIATYTQQASVNVGGRIYELKAENGLIYAAGETQSIKSYDFGTLTLQDTSDSYDGIINTISLA